MSGAEGLIRDLWKSRLQLARPNADIPVIERVVDSIMKDPNGAYAREIRETAERREGVYWIMTGLKS